MKHLEVFRRELALVDPAPERLALAIAGLAYPTLDIPTHLAHLDALAHQMQQALNKTALGRSRAEQFLKTFTHELGFYGNQDDYYDPDNSMLNRVLERRTGLPILLSLLCMSIGRRIDCTISGVGFPGHFMAIYRDAKGAWILDPFHGAVIETHEAATYLTRLFSQPVTLTPDIFAAVAPTLLAQRILFNLRNIYLGRKEYMLAARVIDYLLILTPTEAQLWQERGLLYYQSSDWEQASRDLHRYFFLTDQLMLALGHEQNAEVAWATLPPHSRQLIEIFQQIEAMRRRIN